MVATVERGLLERDFWSMDIAGESPMISSTSGFCICRRNCRAYAESDSTYRRCPSAKIVSNASEDFPLPERPVMTVIAPRGISTEMFFRLCVRAPFTVSQSLPCLCFRSSFCVFFIRFYEMVPREYPIQAQFPPVAGQVHPHPTTHHAICT